MLKQWNRSKYELSGDLGTPQNRHNNGAVLHDGLCSSIALRNVLSKDYQHCFHDGDQPVTTLLGFGAPYSSSDPTLISTMLLFAGSSSGLVPSPLRVDEPVREAYLERGPEESGPPLLSVSPFVPQAMVEHLMRNKKNLAIGRKFETRSGRDAITNMEGALHTFVTPVMQIYMHGDYAFRGRHMVDSFGAGDDGRQLARVVVMSAMVHPDFEFTSVMYKVAALGALTVQGEGLEDGFAVPPVKAKQDAAFREVYDDKLRRHMVQHLTSTGSLPARDAVDAMSYHEAVAFMEAGGSPLGRYVCPQHNPKNVLSMEVLFYSAVQQVINEFSALEHQCPNGYVYTFDAPAIFAAELGATLLNRLFIAAVAHIADCNPDGFKNMRIFAFNDYADPAAIHLMRSALVSHPHVSVIAKASLFPPPGRYVAPASAKHALLVLHNNSDAFGQNIESEGDGGSMDGALGNHSNAAACLHRQHPQLVDNVLDQSKKMRSS